MDIVKKEFLQDLTTFHHFMTSIRRPFRFDGFLPYSVFVVETLVSPDGNGDFDYIDHVVIGNGDEARVPLVLSLRSGRFGIFCVFQDNGLQKQVFQPNTFDKLSGVPLHRIQFLELAVKTAYKHSKLSFSPKYHSFATDAPDSEVVVIPANGPRGDPWEPWSNGEYASMFCSHAVRQGFDVGPPEDFFEGEALTTFLFDEHGRPTVPGVLERLKTTSRR